MTSEVILLDGPMGTELERRGQKLPAPAWSAAALWEAPDLVRQIHRDYAAAGATVHTAATFRTRSRNLAHTPWAGRWDELARMAVSLCREGAGPQALVAGSLSTLEDCFRPDLVPDDATLADEHEALAHVLAEAGCDLLLVETMNTLREMRAATIAAVGTGRPVWAAVTLGAEGDYFDSKEIAQAYVEASELGAEAFLINCTAPHRIGPALETLNPLISSARLGAYGNHIFPGETKVMPDSYAQDAMKWIAHGASIIGGCCGTTPDHIAAISALLQK
ncbi:MAG: homocysteine S-methyltransferase family protein [Planctomycetota bacterium]|nr:homocysteine S-methyltransferase family protein [Planctomycetota bacterium]